MTLKEYHTKRNLKASKEPDGKKGTAGKELRFVVQRHHASHIHYDFRLEMQGVLKSWAIPKGPSLNPAHKRLAIQVEDHPVGYIDFQGTIPPGNYGAGTVEIWDHGTYETDTTEKTSPPTQLKKGSLKLILKGKKLKGAFSLTRLNNDEGNQWLLIKKKDAYALDTEYNSEDHSRNKKKEDKQKAHEKKSANK